MSPALLAMPRHVRHSRSARHSQLAGTGAWAMAAGARDTLAHLRARRRAFLAYPRSVLERPLLADDTDPMMVAFLNAYHDAQPQVAACTPGITRRQRRR